MALARVSSYLNEKQETHVSEQLTDGETAAETSAVDTPAGEATESPRPSKVQRLEHEGDIAAVSYTHLTLPTTERV